MAQTVAAPETVPPTVSRSSTASTASLPETAKMLAAYVVIQISSTGGDEISQYTTKDGSEIVELAWQVVDADDGKQLAHGRSIVKPINAPITPVCTQNTGLTWDSVKDAGTLQDAVNSLDKCVKKQLLDKKKPFSFVTFDSWDLRMRLPKEAREKAIQLPQYLKYPRYFDLRREYQRNRDSAGSSGGDANGSATSGSDSIPTLLSVAESLNIPVDDQKADEPPSAVSLDLLQSLLKSLVDDSRKPHDMGLDLAQFYAEKSKVLYITNLPLDVTQGELESWFTQFGCRPIAFWTIKAPLPEFGAANTNSNVLMMRATCAGFVVFASHEAASDSLAMNGRVLNDRIIEVQPSSAKVLDKAQEILTPFPSSKNRPRPGDWTCPSCGFSNFQRRTACFRCSFPAASAQTVQESMYSNTGAQSGYSQNGYNIYGSGNGANGGAVVGNINGPGGMNNNHHHHHPGAGHQNNHNQGGHQGGHHQYYNRQNIGSSNVPFRAGDWKCTNENCAYHNFAKNVCCLKCGAPRVQSAILTGHAHNPHHSSNNNGNGSGNNSPGGYSGRSYSQGYNNKSRYYNNNQQQQQHSGGNYTQFIAQLSAGSTPTTPSFSDLESLSQQITNLSLSQPKTPMYGSLGSLGVTDRHQEH